MAYTLYSTVTGYFLFRSAAIFMTLYLSTDKRKYNYLFTPSLQFCRVRTCQFVVFGNLGECLDLASSRLCFASSRLGCLGRPPEYCGCVYMYIFTEDKGTYFIFNLNIIRLFKLLFTVLSSRLLFLCI